ncbi:hypothetical protein DH2020_041671 [Rehmannia glutinosa]|uniref:Uncharacterized protein n=1 Tax=Rehmannia glutinosa TaxID=99300 RepID=A0ABR0UPK9_REHGL
MKETRTLPNTLMSPRKSHKPFMRAKRTQGCYDTKRNTSEPRYLIELLLMGVERSNLLEYERTQDPQEHLDKFYAEADNFSSPTRDNDDVMTKGTHKRDYAHLTRGSSSAFPELHRDTYAFECAQSRIFPRTRPHSSETLAIASHFLRTSIWHPYALNLCSTEHLRALQTLNQTSQCHQPMHG